MPYPFKHLLKLRKNAINKRDNESSHRLQERINKLIRSNQLKAVKQENKNQNCGSKIWWSLVNKITGRGNSEVPLSHIIDPKVMNEHFQSINTDPDYVTLNLPLNLSLFPVAQEYLNYPSILFVNYY